MASVTIVFKARVAKAGRNWHVAIPIPLREMIEHRGLYRVTLEPLEEADGDE